MPLIIFHLFHNIAFDLPICKDIKTSAPYLDVDEYFLGEDVPKNNQSISLSTKNDKNLSLTRLDENSTKSLESQIKEKTERNNPKMAQIISISRYST